MGSRLTLSIISLFGMLLTSLDLFTLLLCIYDLFPISLCTGLVNFGHDIHHSPNTIYFSIHRKKKNNFLLVTIYIHSILSFIFWNGKKKRKNTLGGEIPEPH